LVILGVYGSAQGRYGNRCSYPRILRYPREYPRISLLTLYDGNCTDAVSIVNSNVWGHFHDMLA
jgi:hypothetical protein